jgi:nicotinamide-nucleotide amidase
MENELYPQAEALGERLRQLGWRLALAESCTGGWLAKLMTDVPGSSDWFDRGFVTYSNQSKREMLGVDEATLTNFGAVSGETARAMVAGALAKSRAELALAITGIAGPGGGSTDKPVGTVWFAWGRSGADARAARERFDGDREAVRRQAVAYALARLRELADAA